MSSFQFPFRSGAADNICDENICPSSSPVIVNPSDSPEGLLCGGPLPAGFLSRNCDPCSLQNDSSTGFQNSLQFLGCDVYGVSARLGLNGSESSLNVELMADKLSTNTNCKPLLDCQQKCPDESPSPSESVIMNYSGYLGNIYTFSLGKFCFRGILTDHQYIEGSSGFRYRVRLTDGRQVLANVAVIINNLYSRPPDSLRPNLISIPYSVETSVAADDCGSGEKCKDFGKSGNMNKGILLKKIIEGIDGQQCKVPISGACLGIDLSKIIDITPTTYRVTTTESNVLELITLACQEAGYDFYVEIVGYDIRVVPINNKTVAVTDPSTEGPLFQFLQDTIDNYDIIDKEYGQELTFNKSKKLVIGDNLRYLTIVEPLASPCIIDDPGSMYQYEPVFADPAESCNPNP